jgi:hypothetical protein
VFADMAFQFSLYLRIAVYRKNKGTTALHRHKQCQPNLIGIPNNRRGLAKHDLLVGDKCRKYATQTHGWRYQVSD